MIRGNSRGGLKKGKKIARRTLDEEHRKGRLCSFFWLIKGGFSYRE
jgi:hypothetical protein